MFDKIDYSIKKFKLNLNDQIVLTEASTGDYKATAIIADKAGAKRVYALAKNSKYGTIDDIKKGYEEYFKENKSSNIKIINSLEEIKDKINIITNSGFIRPIDEKYLPYLSKNAVVTLMYEPWEFRKSDINLKLLYDNKIKVYGTNEHDKRLLTMDYIGITLLYLLLSLKISHFSNKKILILGTFEFTEPIERVLKNNNYNVEVINDYSSSINPANYDVFVIAEHKNKKEIIGNSQQSYINKNNLTKKHNVIHICGNVDFKDAKFNYLPNTPAPFGYMSYRTDFIDTMALIDLQTGSLKVAEGMLKANKLNLNPKEYKTFMEKNYPALSFEDEKYW